jgi:hypothetical protein
LPCLVRPQSYLKFEVCHCLLMQSSHFH